MKPKRTVGIYSSRRRRVRRCRCVQLVQMAQVFTVPMENFLKTEIKTVKVRCGSARTPCSVAMVAMAFHVVEALAWYSLAIDETTHFFLSFVSRRMTSRCTPRFGSAMMPRAPSLHTPSALRPSAWPSWSPSCRVPSSSTNSRPSRPSPSSRTPKCLRAPSSSSALVPSSMRKRRTFTKV